MKIKPKKFNPKKFMELATKIKELEHEEQENGEFEIHFVLDELGSDDRTAINILNRNQQKLIKRIKKLERKK